MVVTKAVQWYRLATNTQKDYTMQALQRWNNSMWASLEESVTPLPRGSNSSKLAHALPAAVWLPGALATGTVVAACRLASYATSFFCSQQAPAPDAKEDFSAVCNDSRLWRQLGDLQPQVTLGEDCPDFMFGVATCTFQDSGAVYCPNSQWAEWEKKCLPAKNRSQDSASLFKLYATAEGCKEFSDRLKKLGVNSYRFSVEWSQIQPTQYTFDQDVLAIYINLCKHLRDEGIIPMVTLHHFSEPTWFHDLGSFEKEENIAYFVDFSSRVFEQMTQDYKGKPLVEHVCTINEPEAEATLRYGLGQFSPGKYAAVETMGIFLKTVLKAHVAVYAVLKKMNPRVNVGIVHAAFDFIPSNTLVYPVTRYINRIMNEAPFRFFSEGKFELKVPFLCNIVEEGLDAKTDFVGLQYYARPIVGFTGSTVQHDGEAMTDMWFREDPAGLYEAILSAHKAYKAPVIITENGISTHSDEQRSRYMLRALYATQKAQEVIGKNNLQGYFAWSFCDNFEWTFGLDPQRFGAYGVEKIDGKRVLAQEPKPGMASFVAVTRAWQKKFA